MTLERHGSVRYLAPLKCRYPDKDDAKNYLAAPDSAIRLSVRTTSVLTIATPP